MTEKGAAACSDSLTAAASASPPCEYIQCAKPTSFEYFTERYYHQYLVSDCKKVVGNNVRILQHSNTMCIVCLDPSHAAIAAVNSGTGVTIASIAFGSGRANSQVAPENIKVVGKRKKNALICQIDTKLCTVTLSDGTAYPIPVCINGFILELNATLMAHPWMAAAAPTAEGFLAVINPSAKNDLGVYSKVWTATGGDNLGDDDDEAREN